MVASFSLNRELKDDERINKIINKCLTNLLLKIMAIKVLISRNAGSP